MIPSYGRPRQLAACLGALAALEGGPYRTVVVDDGSPEPLAPVGEAAGDNVVVLRQAQSGPGVARNRGVAAAEGARIVLFTDDDCHPRPDWALRLAAGQGEVAWRLAGGRVENGLTDNPYSAASQAILSYSYRSFGTFDGPLDFFTTNNIAVRREDFLSLGGFDAGFAFASEDRDFSRRWKAAGGTLHYASDAVVDHHHALTLRAFLSQHRSYGVGARRFHRSLKGPRGTAWSWGKPGFYAGLLLHPLARPGLGALRRTTLIGLAHAALLEGYLRERRAERAARRDEG